MEKLTVDATNKNPQPEKRLSSSSDGLTSPLRDRRDLTELAVTTLTTVTPQEERPSGLFAPRSNSLLKGLDPCDMSRQADTIQKTTNP